MCGPSVRVLRWTRSWEGSWRCLPRLVQRAIASQSPKSHSDIDFSLWIHHGLLWNFNRNLQKIPIGDWLKNMNESCSRYELYFTKIKLQTSVKTLVIFRLPLGVFLLVSMIALGLRPREIKFSLVKKLPMAVKYNSYISQKYITNIIPFFFLIKYIYI